MNTRGAKHRVSTIIMISFLFEIQQKLGFIGIGLMRKSLILRLLETGFHLNVWNRTFEKLQAA